MVTRSVETNKQTNRQTERTDSVSYGEGIKNNVETTKSNVCSGIAVVFHTGQLSMNIMGRQ